jgi:hypothetical protein
MVWPLHTDGKMGLSYPIFRPGIIRKIQVHDLLKKMIDPKRPWRHLEWIRIVDYYHACLSIKELADALFGLTAKGQAWAQQMRKSMKTKSDGITRV